MLALVVILSISVSSYLIYTSDLKQEDIRQMLEGDDWFS